MALSETFMSDLLDGRLSSLRRFLVDDQSLCPEIRANTLTIYYRGGGLLKLDEFSGNYRATFGEKGYAAKCQEPRSKAWATTVAKLPKLLKTAEDTEQWLATVPLLKAVMDRWFVTRNWTEREAQQRMVFENNRDRTIAVATDYYFCDMERVELVSVNGKKSDLRFDLVGVHWPSDKAIRKSSVERSFVLVEMKYGDNAHQGNAGLLDHWKRLRTFLAEDGRLARLKEEMCLSFNQKRSLGFIECRRPLSSFNSGPVEWLLVLANHDPEKTGLAKELKELNGIVEHNLVRVRIATSNFLGYGLWDQAILDLATFLQQYRERTDQAACSR